MACTTIHIFKKGKNRFKGLKTSLNKLGVFSGSGVGLFIGIILLGSCASIQTPLGGPKDENPPKVKKEFPKNLSTNFSAKQIDLSFDEFIKLNNAFNEISISPALEKPLEVKSKKTELEIKIDGSLEPNTTYTINFGKAIGDVNENNILKNYSYVFSTGPILDSLSISGTVKNAISNEPVKDATVFILTTKQDSLFGKKKPSIYTNTDEKGNFKLSNLRADEYRVYALKETSPDRIYNAGTDEIGVLTEPLKLNKNTSNLLFRLFKEVSTSFKLVEKKLEPDGKILLSFNKGLEKPSIKELESNSLLKNTVISFNTRGDSASIWLPELSFDSLKLGIYDNDVLVDKATILRNKREILNRTPVVRDNITNNKLKPGVLLELGLSMPINMIDSSKISLIRDSLEQKGWSIIKRGNANMKLGIKYPLRTGATYTIKIAEGAFTGISGLKSKAYSKTFLVDNTDNYGNLLVAVTLADSTKQYVMQLLNEQKNILREDIVKTGTNIDYKTYTTGKYNLRFVLDENRNGKWDTGNVEKLIQPEKIWNYEKVIILRANWDQTEKITIPTDF